MTNETIKTSSRYRQLVTVSGQTHDSIVRSGRILETTSGESVPGRHGGRDYYTLSYCDTGRECPEPPIGGIYRFWGGGGVSGYQYWQRIA